MEELQEFERRITRALDRIGAGIEALDGLARPGSAAEPGEAERLAEALAAERDANAQLGERVKALNERLAAGADQESRLEELTRQVDEQALELQRQKTTNVQLREQLRALQEAQEKAATEGAEAELAALRAARAAEIAELDGILAELRPLIGENSHA